MKIADIKKPVYIVIYLCKDFVFLGGNIGSKTLTFSIPGLGGGIQISGSFDWFLMIHHEQYPKTKFI